MKTVPVEHRETLALGGALALGPTRRRRRAAAARAPGRRSLRGLGDDTPLDRWVLGDLALGARLRLAQREHVAASSRAAQLTLPTGDDHDFAGEARYTAAWMLIGAFALPHGVVARRRRRACASAAARSIVADRLLGDELSRAIGATYELPAVPGLWCAANHVRVTAELDRRARQRRRGPARTVARRRRASACQRIRPWLAVAARVGKGLDDQIGAPRFRGLLELVYGG